MMDDDRIKRALRDGPPGEPVYIPGRPFRPVDGVRPLPVRRPNGSVPRLAGAVRFVVVLVAVVLVAGVLMARSSQPLGPAASVAPPTSPPTSVVAPSTPPSASAVTPSAGPSASVVTGRAFGLAAGSLHTCALVHLPSSLPGYGVRCWGSNAAGQLGDGGRTDSSTPVEVVSLGAGVKAITAGLLFTCALTVKGGVKCWGDDTYGELGDGSNTQSSTPVDVVGLASGVTAIAAGSAHVCAITSVGGVKCWGGYCGCSSATPSSYVPAIGADAPGVLGDGRNVDSNIPVDVFGLASGVVGIGSGDEHSCAFAANGGRVVCWGYGGDGQLGNGSMASSNTPVDATGLSGDGTAIVADLGDTCLITSAARVRCWGSGLYGELGTGSTTSSSVPVDVTGLSRGITAIAAGGSHVCAVMQDGSVRCWGKNPNGELGTGSLTDSSTPVDVVGLAGPVTAVAAGALHSCALTSARTVECWGDDSSGQVGDGRVVPGSEHAVGPGGVPRPTPVPVVGL